MWRSGAVMMAACCVVSVIGSASALAAPGPRTEAWVKAKAKSSGAVQRFDANHDGVLQESERAALKKDILERLHPFQAELVTQYDRNRNGVLDPPEQTVMKQDRDVRRAKLHAIALARYDANHNGEFDPEEKQTMKVEREAFLAEQKQQMLQTFDTNHDGVLDPGEKTAIQKLAAAKRTQALQAYDGNRDGRLDQAEREAAVKGARSAAKGGSEATLQETPPSLDGTLSNVRALRGGQGLQLDFTMGRAGNVSVKVFDAQGRLVRNVVSNEAMEAGARSVRWDGQGQDGRPSSNGVYWMAIEALGKKVSRKMALLR